MNKRYFSLSYRWFLPAAVLWLAGCTKQLDLSPESQLSDKNFWKTTSDLGQACNYLYTFLNGLGTDDPSGAPTPVQDNYSDLTFGDGSVGIGDNSRVAPATSNEWTNYYKAIRAANNILEKSATVTGDAGLISRYLGEARFFRGMAYFELVKRFGDVPYINRTLTASDSMLYAARTARQSVIDSIYADLDFAAANCPQPDVLAAAEYGRITRTAALAYKSRVALFEGTWDKFRSISTATRNLQAAVDASNTVITENKHALYTAQGADSYYYEFQYAGGANGNPVQTVTGAQVNYTYATNKENIIVRLYGQNQSNNIASHNFGRAYLDQAHIAPTKAIMDTYLFKDGLPEGASAYDTSNAQTSSLTEFRNRDPRISMSVYNNTLITPSVGGLIPYVAGTTYRYRKYWIVSDWAANISFVNFNVLRYAEVLLNYAEASFELNGSISDQDLNLTINALRNRATGNDVSKLPLLTNAFVSGNNLNMETEIRRERSVELAFEGQAYWDILRWKTAEVRIPNAVLGRKYFPAENPGGTTPNLLNGSVLLEAASFRKFDPAKNYLWPLPTKELALNDKLKQNLNW
jgi:hypothetical protein